MRSILLTAAAAALIAFSPVASNAQDLTYLTENWAPFNWEDDAGKHGVSIEMLEEILKRAGIEDSVDDVQFMPWVHAYELLKKTPDTVAFSTIRTPDREELFKWAGPIHANHIALIVRKEDLDKYKTLDAFHSASIGTMRDDAAEHVLAEKGFDIEDFDRNGTAGDIVKKLHAGSVDAILTTASVAFWIMKNLGYDLADYAVAKDLVETHIYYGFNLETSDETVDKFQKAIDSMTADGTIEKIKSKYGL